MKHKIQSKKKDALKLPVPWLKFVSRWEKITSPGRPSYKEIKIYEAFLKSVLKKRDSNVLVIGATPEIRDMLAKYDVEVTLIDINHEMILAMSHLMKKKNNKENWLKANWLHAPLAKNYFNAVIGDFVIGNLSPENHEKFLKNVSEWLKKDGIFVTRCEGYPKDYKPVSVEYLIEWHLKKPLVLKTYNSFSESLIFYTTDSAPLKGVIKIDVQECWKKVDKIYKNLKNNKARKLIKESKKLYPQDMIWFVSAKSRILKLFNKFFTLKAEEFDSQLNMIYPENYLIYKLVKR